MSVIDLIIEMDVCTCEIQDFEDEIADLENKITCLKVTLDSFEIKRGSLEGLLSGSEDTRDTLVKEVVEELNKTDITRQFITIDWLAVRKYYNA